MEPGEFVDYEPLSPQGYLPSYVVPCKDPDVPNCFLAHSEYGEGICTVRIGKADKIANRMYFVDPLGEAQLCTFIRYLRIYKK